MKKYKNSILIIIAIVLFVYTAIISVYPFILTKTFNIETFEQKLYDTTSIVTTVDSVDFKVQPNFKMIITLRNWSSKYVDSQNLFDANLIQLKTSLLAPITKTFKIDDLYLKNVKYENQTLPNGENKIAFLPKAFNSKFFGANKITIISGPVRIKNFKIKDIAIGYYKEDNRRQEKYTKEEVRNFLSRYNFEYVNIK